MINLFKNKNATIKKEIDVNSIIEEIHETFYTEIDKLLKEAKILNSINTNKQDLIDKCNRLKSIGFTNTKEVKEAEKEIERLDKLKSENDHKKNLVEAINYFSFKYPNYKFITEESVKKICDKYNLVYGKVINYIGEVPTKNLKHIEDFKIDKGDECYLYVASTWGPFGEYIHEKKYIPYEEKPKYNEGRSFRSSYTIDVNKCSLEIVAPLKDFNMKGMEIKDFKVSKIEIPDPVVLKPVIYNNQKYYLIVTAWGLEANDELVLNQRHN